MDLISERSPHLCYYKGLSRLVRGTLCLILLDNLEEPNWFANSYQKLNLVSKALDQGRLDYRFILCTGAAA